MDFLQSLYSQYNELSRQRKLLDANLTKIAELILLNNGQVPGEVSMEYTTVGHIPGEYNPKANWQDKIKYILSKATRPLTASEIASEIRLFEPHTEKSVEKSVTLTTSRMSRDGEIIATKEGVKNYYSIKQ
jgi:hypothetical protein